MADQGTHILCDVKGCPSAPLDNVELLSFWACAAADAANAEILDISSHRFEPYGVTILVLLADSHLSIHTWPELGHAAIDFYTCGNLADADEGVVYLIQALDATHFGLHRVSRPVEMMLKPVSWWRRLFSGFLAKG